MKIILINNYNNENIINLFIKKINKKILKNH